jgi:hypothetical protein
MRVFTRSKITTPSNVPEECFISSASRKRAECSDLFPRQDICIDERSNSALTRVEVKSIVQEILFPPAGQLRARKVVTRSRARNTGKYPSWKMKRMIEYESVHELNAFRLLDCDPRVTAFREQPCKIAYLQGEETRIHFPDVLVQVRGGREMWEVKTRSEAVRQEISDRTLLLTEHLPHWGYIYRVVLADDLANQPRLANATTLLQYGHRPVGSRKREEMRMLLEAHGSLSYVAARDGAYGKTGREATCRLILEGALTFDPKSPIEECTYIVAASGGF